MDLVAINALAVINGAVVGKQEVMRGSFRLARHSGTVIEDAWERKVQARRLVVIP